MAEDILQKSGLYFDDLNKLRLLQPQTHSESCKLKEECQEFVTKMSQFQEITDKFSTSLETIASAVNTSKLEAIGSRSQLKGLAKERELEQHHMKSLISQKKMELERLRLQYENLVSEERKQIELLENITIS